jgi:hypothetical protein
MSVRRSVTSSTSSDSTRPRRMTRERGVLRESEERREEVAASEAGWV